MSTLVLRLEGPLQAWSTQGKLGIRDTEREPTKSGVLGLVGAALGMSRDDDETLAHLAALSMAVRVDQPGSLLRDYHTAGGGRFREYSDRGKKFHVHGAGSVVLSERYYLQDASFVAALGGDDVLVERIGAALRAPRWPIFLGRRSCPPSRPVFEAMVACPVADAVRGAAVNERVKTDSLRLAIEATPESGGEPRYDVPLSFKEGERRYTVRYVRTEWLPLVGPAKEVHA